MSSSLSIFRVAPYSPSTSRITIHRDKAVHLHKFLTEEGMAVEPMVEAEGTVLLGYVDESGNAHLKPEIEIITFVADATPSMLQPLLQQWLEALVSVSETAERQLVEGSPVAPFNSESGAQIGALRS